MEKISIIVPCYNEEKAIPLFYKELQKNLKLWWYGDKMGWVRVLRSGETVAF